MKLLGRLIVRDGKTMGVFYPMEQDGTILKPGIYNIIDWLDTPTLEYVGKPANDVKTQALSVEQLNYYPECILTKEELKEVAKK